MQPPPVPAAADQEPGVSPSDRKRKRSVHQPAATSDAQLAKQQTIQQLFSTRGKPSASPQTTGGLSPDFKRTRQQQPGSSPPPQTSPSPSLPREKMYSFTSKQPSGDVVDLTKSAPRNGQPRRLSIVKPVRTNLNPHAGAKKLVVKNLKKESAWDADKYFDEIWNQLDNALSKIFQDAQVAFSREDLYRGVENVCRQGKASAVNARLNERCLAHFQNDVLKSLLSKSGRDNVSVLRAVLAAWSSWNAQNTLIRGIFYYMDRSYLLQSSKTSLHEIFIQLFRDNIFNNPVLKPKIVDGACDLITTDRTDKGLDHSMLRQAIAMFHDLATYSNSFEPRLLALSQTYVRDLADKESSEKNVPEYVKAAVSFMTKEVERCEVFGLDATTRRDLLTLLEEYLVQQKTDYLISAPALASLLDDNAMTDLEQLYTLLQRRRLGSKLKDPFAKWVDQTGTAIVFDDKAEDEMVVRLLSLKQNLDLIWRTSFHRDDELGHGLRESFEAFINKTKKGESTWGTDNSKPGEMIAKYVDLLLRGGAKAIPAQLTTVSRDTTTNEQEEDDDRVDEETEVNVQLDQVLDLFRFVHGKAVFEAFYKKDLAKRLLMGRSASADAERSMLARLKTECGAGFTQNLEQMFKDVELAREEMSSYKARLEEQQEKAGKMDLSVNILSAAAWPTYPDVPVIIPADVNLAIERFERHYKSKHSGRRLSWKHALAHCQMRAQFPKGSKEFVVSSFQAVILLLFNGLAEDEHLTYEYIKTASGLCEFIKTLLLTLSLI